MPGMQRRTRRRKIPPYIDLSQSIEIANDIYRRFGKTVSRDDLSAVLGNTPQSSSFYRKNRSMTRFGLLEEVDRNTYHLTTLALRIVSDPSSAEATHSRLRAFRNVEPFARMQDLYAGKVCPDESALADAMERAGAVREEFKFEWAAAFMESARTAGVVSEQDGTVVAAPESGLLEGEHDRETPKREGVARLVFPFRGKGEARISFPESLSEDEMEKLIMFLRAYTSQGPD